MHVFEKNGHQIIFGDALLALAELVPNNSIDLIFADPPYNIGKRFNGSVDKWSSDGAYLDWCYQWLDLCIKKLKDNGSLYVMTATQYMPYFDMYLRERIHILSRIIWHYDSSGVQAKKYYGSLYEPILYCVKDKNNYIFNAKDIVVPAKTGADRKLIDYRKPTPTMYNAEKIPGNVWQFPRVRYRMAEYEDHPSQKPIALLERIIKASSNIGDIVLDPFSGTFTTSYVAQLLKRQSIGIEMSEEYTKIGLRRLGIRDMSDGTVIEPQEKSFKQQIDMASQSRMEL